MSTIKALYGSEQTFTITLAGLTNGSARQTTEIDNSSNLYLDALVQFQIKTGSGAGAGSFVEIRAYASADNGTTRTENAGASDAAITLTSPENTPLVDIINTPAATTTYKGNPASVAKAFGGVLPKKWGIIIVNRSASTLSATEGDHLKLWQGIQEQVV